MADIRKLSLKMKKRMRVVGVLLILLGFVTVGVRLFFLQVIDGRNYRRRQSISSCATSASPPAADLSTIGTATS